MTTTDSAPSFGQTPSQTVGPFFGFALPYAGGQDLVPPGSAGAVRLHGTLLDGAGDPIPDGLIELWQVGPDGKPMHAFGSLHRDGWTFSGYGRAATDGGGGFTFTTLRPPSYALITVFARGLLKHLFTRAYFPRDDGKVANDRFLDSVDGARHGTLIAEPDGPASYRFDIVLQGTGETVFIDYGVE